MRILCVVPANIKHETVQFLGLKAKGLDMHVMTVCKLDPDYSQLVEAGIPVTTVSINKRIDLEAVARIRDYIKSNNINIVHAFNNKTVSNALRACKGLGVRFVAYRGIVGNVSFLNPSSWQTYLNPRVDKIVCVADAIRKYLLDLKFFGLKIPPEKLITIYKGHDPSWYQNDPISLSQFNIPKDKFVVACVANYRPRKGVEVLIDSLQYVPEDLDIHIVLIGRMENSALQKHLANSPHKDRVHCIGHQDNAPQIQASCDVCVLPSLKREGLPKSVIEGMAYGVPPVVTDSGGSPELVEHNISGLVVKPNNAKELADAFTKLYHDKELRTRMGKAAKDAIATRFNTQQTIDKTFMMYKELKQ